MATSREENGKVYQICHIMANLKTKPLKKMVKSTPRLLNFTKLRGVLHFLPKPSNIFTQIYLPYLWHFATLSSDELSGIFHLWYSWNSPPPPSQLLMKQFRALQLVLLYQILVIQSWLQPIGRSWVAISSVSGRYTLEGFNTLRGNPVEAATTSDVPFTIR